MLLSTYSSYVIVVFGFIIIILLYRFAMTNGITTLSQWGSPKSICTWTAPCSKLKRRILKSLTTGLFTQPKASTQLWLSVLAGKVSSLLSIKSSLRPNEYVTNDDDSSFITHVNSIFMLQVLRNTWSTTFMAISLVCPFFSTKWSGLLFSPAFISAKRVLTCLLWNFSSLEWNS